jgi:hypothetical protein
VATSRSAPTSFKPLWLAIVNIDDKRTRVRLARQQDGKCRDQPARFVEGQRVMG